MNHCRPHPHISIFQTYFLLTRAVLFYFILFFHFLVVHIYCSNQIYSYQHFISSGFEADGVFQVVCAAGLVIRSHLLIIFHWAKPQTLIVKQLAFTSLCRHNQTTQSFSIKCPDETEPIWPMRSNGSWGSHIGYS